MKLVAIIDDAAPVRLALVRLVRSFGYAACSYVSAAEFLNSGAARRCTCLVTDVQMPGMNGLELQRHLAEVGAALPVIFITAFPEDRIRAQAIAAGAIGFLGKPFDANALEQCLAQACGPAAP